MGSQSSKETKETKATKATTEPTKPKEEKIIVGDRNAPRKVEYGSLGAPVSMFCGEMSQELMEELHKLDIFSCPEEELEGKGFYRCVDYPHLPSHIYYEGYFHSCRTSEPIKSINPRQGSTFDKPSAPPLLRACYIAFREKNQQWLRGIHEEIKKIQIDEEKAGDAKAVFEKAFDPDNEANEQVMGDLAIQVHYGHPIEGDNIGFHTDALNSAFHFAFAVRGNRSLHSFRSTSEEGAQSRQFDHHVDPQKVGDVYISSPAFFRHGVEYPETTWEDRIVAIQARFLLSREDHDKTIHLKIVQGEAKLSQVIANALVSGPVLPSYEEILAVRETLKD